MLLGKKGQTILGQINRIIICKTHDGTLAFGLPVGSTGSSAVGTIIPRGCGQNRKNLENMNKDDEGSGEGSLLEKAEGLRAACFEEQRSSSLYGCLQAC